MRNRTTELKVGIAVILAAIILILGIVWIGEFRLSRRWESYFVYFDEVGGLSPGDPVTISGVEMGKVGSVLLENGRVKAELLIEEQTAIREDCTVDIRSIGLMGEKYVHILPGTSGDTLALGAELEGRYRAGLPEVAAGMGDVISELIQASRSFRKILSVESSDYTLAESISKLNSLSSEILMVLRENRDDIRSTAKSMKSVSEDIEDIVGNRKQQVIEGVEKFSAAAGRFDSLTVSMRAIINSVEKGEGTLGLLIKERKIHEDIESTLETLDTLLKDIKEHPERYFRVEIF